MNQSCCKAILLFKNGRETFHVFPNPFLRGVSRVCPVGWQTEKSASGAELTPQEKKIWNSPLIKKKKGDGLVAMVTNSSWIVTSTSGIPVGLLLSRHVVRGWAGGIERKKKQQLAVVERDRLASQWKSLCRIITTAAKPSVGCTCRVIYILPCALAKSPWQRPSCTTDQIDCSPHFHPWHVMLEQYNRRRGKKTVFFVFGSPPRDVWEISINSYPRALTWFNSWGSLPTRRYQRRPSGGFLLFFFLRGARWSLAWPMCCLRHFVVFLFFFFSRVSRANIWTGGDTGRRRCDSHRYVQNCPFFHQRNCSNKQSKDELLRASTF